MVKVYPGIISLIFMISLIISFSCKNDAPEDLSHKSFDLSEFSSSVASEAKEISYTMSLPVEMARLFEHVGANYYPEFLNPANEFGKYTEPVKIALNLGVFGVDLSYVKMFSQHQKSVAYLTAINRLASELGIPKEIYNDVLENLELFVTNQDSLAKVSARLYGATDRFLMENGREGSASLVAMGGWIESMYIASRIFQMNPGNIELQEKMAEQKYSLNSLISLMNNYHEDLELAEYLLMLKNLRRSYNKFDIYYKKGDIQVDTTSKKISAGGYVVNVTPDQVLEIADKVVSLRTLIIH